MAENDSNPLVLDGSRGEGGGSILRVGAGLACVKNCSLKVINNELPRRKQRGIKWNIFNFLAASGGELTPEGFERIGITQDSVPSI